MVCSTLSDLLRSVLLLEVCGAELRTTENVVEPKDPGPWCVYSFHARAAIKRQWVIVVMLPAQNTFHPSVRLARPAVPCLSCLSCLPASVHPRRSTMYNQPLAQPQADPLSRAGAQGLQHHTTDGLVAGR
jgi:hypothetical protein